MSATWRKSLAIAWPVMLANIITPLIGLVDSALMGRLPDAAYGAAVGVAAMVVGYIVFGCNFLSFSMSGLSANAKGNNNASQAIAAWQQHAALAVTIGFIIIALQAIGLEFLLALLSPDEILQNLAQDYLVLRLLNAPIILLNLCFIGFFIGQGLTRVNLLASLSAQLVNLLLSGYLVLVANWQVTGVAVGSIAAEWLMLLIYSSKLKQWCNQNRINLLGRQHQYMPWHSLRQRGNALWLRGLVLTSSVASLPWLSATLGNNYAASVTIALNFFLLSSSLLDGFAQATEAQVGAALNRSWQEKRQILVTNSILLFGLSTIIVLFLLINQHWIVTFITKVTSVQLALVEIWPLLLLMIAAGSAAFFLDGVFIGLNQVNKLRDAVIYPALIFYFPSLFFINTAAQLLTAFALFLALRSVLLAISLQNTKKV